MKKATHVPRILIVGAQHGDERLGPRLNRFLKRDTSGRYATVEYMCGNPRAFRQNVRFTETDLNRSYTADPPRTYEEKRAKEILRVIEQGGYDYVLDVHTSRPAVGRFFIATHIGGSVAHIIAASDFERVAIMPPDIAGCSLIGRVPQAIAIEYDRRISRSKQTLKELVSLLDNLLVSTPNRPRPREIFYVDGTIPLDSGIANDAKNFERCNQGFYPVIFTPRNGSYRAHHGFRAGRKETRVL